MAARTGASCLWFTAVVRKRCTQRRFLANAQADKYKDLKGGNISAALSQDFPKLDIKAPTFYSGSDHVVNTNVAGLQLSATGLSFSPCAVPMGPVGISLSATVSSHSPPRLVCLERQPHNVC